MGLLGSRNASSPQSTVPKDIVALYQRLRPIRLHLNNELVRRLGRDVLNDGAKGLASFVAERSSLTMKTRRPC